MMQNSKEYAGALFALALETDQVNEFSVALGTVSEAIKAEPEYEELLACYGIPAEERTKALEEAFGDTVPEYVLSFVQLLCEHGHIRGLSDCVREYEALRMELQRTATVHVTSAIELTADQRARLEEKLKALCKRQVVAVYTVDASIMGGVIVEADGKVLDGSVKHRLQEMKDVMDA